MIELEFSLFWCGGNISYLRYLTFKTLRHFHPDSVIKLYVSKQYNKHIHNWDIEKQDFETEITQDYKANIAQLGVKIIEMDYFGSPDFCAIRQADMFRFWSLYHFGGFYLDTDQLILKSFNTLPLNKNLIYSQFSNVDRSRYAPTGVIGCAKGDPIAKIAMKIVNDTYTHEVYNSSGPIAWETVLEEVNKSEHPEYSNVPEECFYPINCSSDIGKVYNGSYIIPKPSYCLHLYLGHPLSQEFNKKYTESFAKTSNDTISKFLRGLS